MDPRPYRDYSRPQRRMSRRIPMPGDGDEYGHWFHCWQCGHPNNDLTEPLDDGATKAHTEYTDFVSISTGASPGKPLSAQVYHEDRSTVFVSMRLMSNGEVELPVHLFEAVRTNGCPVCGTTNWRGDF